MRGWREALAAETEELREMAMRGKDQELADWFSHKRRRRPVDEF
jgi:hypothetical protein